MAADVRDLIVSSITAVTVAVEATPDSAWDEPTPCREWTVSAVVQHLIDEAVEQVRAVTGRAVETVGPDHADLPLSWREAAAAAAEAWSHADLDRQLETTSGPISCGEYAEWVLLELVVHRWDVQRGAGTGIEVDGAALSHVLDWAEAHKVELERSGSFDPPVRVESEYAVDRLMALLGRDPRLSS